jgi:predicted Ser/Thr protein kinase
LPLSQFERVVAACDHFEAAWRGGGRPRIEDHLGGVPEPARLALFGELLALEVAYRHRAGEAPTPGEYRTRFPGQEALIQDVFAETLPVGPAGSPPPGTEGPGPRAAPASPPRCPQAIGKYRVIDAIDTGGQAELYRAVHPELAKELAIKLARRPLGEADRAALIEEGKLLAGLEHPNLVRVHDVDFFEDRPFLVMEFVRGRNLQQVAAQERPGSRQAAAMVAKLAGVLSLAHRRGIVHYDLKPRNILVDERGEPRLIDFGMARLRHAWSDGAESSPGGTITYMAPEQARLETGRIGPCSDLFALGGVLYFLLTGRAPFEGATGDERRARACRCDFDARALRAAGAPRRLERIVLRAMAAEPADRFASAEAFQRALRRHLHRPKALAAAAGLAMLALLIAQALAWPRPWSSPPAPSTATIRLDRAPVAPPVPVRIEGMELTHSRGDGATDLGTIGVDDASDCLFNDEVRIRARLSGPAYCYLIALHPDGSTQLYYPEGDAGEATPPPLSDRLSYPAGTNLSPLTDGVGLQAYVLVASRQRLPAYREWKARLGDLPWGQTRAEGVWHYDGQQFEPRSRRRSVPRPAGVAVPAPFAAACRALRQAPGIDAIDAWAFPVRSKDSTQTAGAPPQEPGGP